MARLVILAKAGDVQAYRLRQSSPSASQHLMAGATWPRRQYCERAAMKALIVLLLIASHHPSKHKLPERNVGQLPLPSIRFIMPVWCSVPHIDQYLSRCMVYRI